MSDIESTFLNVVEDGNASAIELQSKGAKAGASEPDDTFSDVESAP